MEANPAVAKGQKFFVLSGRNQKTYDDVWKKLAAGLNSLGPPTRSVPEWQRVWTDQKLQVKKKLAHNKKEANATGGGPNTFKILSPTDEVVAKLLSLDKFVETSGTAFGLNRKRKSSSPVPSTSGLASSGLPILSSTMNEEPVEEEDALTEEEEELVENEVELVQNSHLLMNVSNSASKRKRKNPDGDMRQELLAEQTALLRKITEHTAEIARYSRKTFHLREEEAKRKQEYRIRKEKNRANELEYKLELLKYKKKKLELLERKEKKK